MRSIKDATPLAPQVHRQWAHAHEHPRPALAVDCVVFGLDDGDLKVLLIQRGLDPFRGRWALPGGFVRMTESLEQAALRELAEKTGLTGVYLEQLHTFGRLTRDPRGRTVTIAYYALVALAGRPIAAPTHPANAAWFAVRDLPTLAFDHDRILRTAVLRLKAKVRCQPIGFELLPREFTLSQLQHLYETLLERPLDKRNFRKKILGMEVLKETDHIEAGVAHRAARLYRFDEARYHRLVKKGFNFETGSNRR